MSDIASGGEAAIDSAVSEHAYPEGVRPIDGLYAWTRGMLYASAATTIAMSTLNAAVLAFPNLVDEYSGAPLTPVEYALAIALFGVSILYTVIFVVCIVMVSRFTYRAMRNLHTVGEPIAEMSPGWAVGWYFIPFANLFKPFQGMSQIYNGSLHAAGEAPRGSTPLPLWWAMWLLGNISANVAFQVMNDLTVSTIADVISTALLVVATVALLRIIRTVANAQRMIALGGQASVFA